MTRLVAIGGFSGSGKTALAAALAQDLPDTVHFDSDRVRKELSGVAPETRLPPEAYTHEATLRLIAEMDRRVRGALASGKNVFVSALFDTPKSRAEEEALAAACGADFSGLWLQAGQEVLIARVNLRKGDVSDATADIVRQQMDIDTGAITWALLDAALPQETILAQARARIAF